MPENRPALLVFLVAGEESGDRLGAAFMRAIKARAGRPVQFSGVGGSQMAAEGLASLFPLETTGLIGFSQIPWQLRTYLRRIQQTAASVIMAQPDVLVIIDSPEFTHRIAKRVRQQAPEIPVVDYVSPSVWAWRPWRARAMRRYIDHVMAILPFEPAAMARLGGPPCTFVGHPLSERAATLRPDAEEARRREAAPPIVLLMPGSRQGEITRMLPMFERVAERIAGQVGGVQFVLPTVPALAGPLAAAVESWRVSPRIVSDQAEKDAAFRVARLAIVKSGTSTLELAVAGVPMVAVYRVGALEAFVVRRMLQVQTVILANLVLGEHIVPEFLQERATPANIVEAALPLFADSPERRRQIDAFKRLDRLMEIGHAIPSERAAEIVLAHARNLSATCSS
jgi:lipid-A-disaccharide synthase